jgi:subtilisin
MSEPARDQPEELPAWSLSREAAKTIALRAEWPDPVSRAWAWGESQGEGVRVCILDSGVEAEHRLVRPVDEAVVVVPRDDRLVLEEDQGGDVSGHGTACASIVRAIAPACRLGSVRVLGGGFTGSGEALLAGLRWAVESGYDVVNMSLSTTKRAFAHELHELADAAYFRRTVLVASAHNMPVESYPWRFASVISVGCHDGADPLAYYYNPTPPVEFFARGVGVEVAWPGDGQIRSTGNSLATPHLTGVCALILSEHPRLTPFELKSLLYLTATNVGGGR